MRRSILLLRPLVLVPLMLICLITAVVYCAAYWYRPAENRTYQSPYLRNITSGFVRTQRFRIHYTRSGTGPAIILVHGAGSWLYSFRNNVPGLAQNFTVYTLDMPGHGYTIPLAAGPSYDLDTMSGALEEFMDALGIDRADIVGHSSGGGWAIHFTHNHPERVRGLVLIDSNGLDHPVSLIFKLFTYPVIGELFSKFFTTEDVRRGLLDAFFNKELVTREMVCEIKTPLTFIENRRAQYLGIRNQDWKITQRELPRIAAPTLVIWGENDRYLSHSMAERFRDIMPDAFAEVLENCGHSAHEERPEKVNAMITAFLTGQTR